MCSRVFVAYLGPAPDHVWVVELLEQRYLPDGGAGHALLLLGTRRRTRERGGGGDVAEAQPTAESREGDTGVCVRAGTAASSLFPPAPGLPPLPPHLLQADLFERHDRVCRDVARLVHDAIGALAHAVQLLILCGVGVCAGWGGVGGILVGGTGGVGAVGVGAGGRGWGEMGALAEAALARASMLAALGAPRGQGRGRGRWWGAQAVAVLCWHWCGGQRVPCSPVQLAAWRGASAAQRSRRSGQYGGRPGCAPRPLQAEPTRSMLPAQPCRSVSSAPWRRAICVAGAPIRSDGRCCGWARS